MYKIKKAIIPAAGFGTRFLPITKSFPKEMLPIIDIPNIQYLVEEAVLSGIKDILIIISKSKSQIVDYFKDNEKLYKFLEEHGKLKEVKNLKKIVSMANISFAYQNTPKGLGDAILYAEDFVKEEPFAVLLGDDLVDIDVVPATKELIETYNETKSTVVGCKEIDEKDLYKFGVVKPKDKVTYPFFEIVDFVEKPKDISLAPSKVASLGRYILTKDIFPALKNTSKGVGGEIQLTDAIKSLIATKKVFVRLFTGKRYDIGDKFGYVEAIIDYALKRDDLKEKIISYMKEKIK